MKCVRMIFWESIENLGFYRTDHYYYVSIHLTSQTGGQPLQAFFIRHKWPVKNKKPFQQRRVIVYTSNQRVWENLLFTFSFHQPRSGISRFPLPAFFEQKDAFKAFEHIPLF